MTSSTRVPVFDLDGTLLDSDEALVAPFLALGIRRDQIHFGEPVRSGCERLGVSLDDYVAGYDPARSRPFDGVTAMLASLDRWAVCSNKHPVSGRADLVEWSWFPEVALFSDAFDWENKQLGPVLDRLGLSPADIVYVGDSPHDQEVAQVAGCTFVVAAWNPRAAGLAGDIVLHDPADLPAVLAGYLR
jgi:phosphoglycolate phosphatase-like HAD superfamily hydrolase